MTQSLSQKIENSSSSSGEVTARLEKVPKTDTGSKLSGIFDIEMSLTIGATLPGELVFFFDDSDNDEQE